MAKLKSFKEDCLNLDPDIVVQKYLLDGSCYYFDMEKDINEFGFKISLAASLEVHIRDIAIVGSGKLGFSIKPDKDVPEFYPFKMFDENRRSDLDIAIVSKTLFDKQLIKIFDHTSRYSNKEIWNRNGDRNSLAKYVLKGWLKPEFLPKNYFLSKDIQEVRSNYKRKYGREINIGIYKSWHYFEAYHIDNIKNISLNLIAEG